MKLFYGWGGTTEHMNCHSCGKKTGHYRSIHSELNGFLLKVFCCTDCKDLFLDKINKFLTSVSNDLFRMIGEKNEH